MSHDKRIAKRRSDMSELYRPLYDRAVSGQASPREAIKSFCLECMGWQRLNVATCTSAACPLHRYRPYQQDVDALRPDEAADAHESSNAGASGPSGHEDGCNG